MSDSDSELTQDTTTRARVVSEPDGRGVRGPCPLSASLPVTRPVTVGESDSDGTVTVRDSEPETRTLGHRDSGR